MEGMESNNFKRKRWNLLGFIASVISTFALIGLILYGQGHKEQLNVVLSILTVILVIAFFLRLSGVMLKKHVKTN